MEGHPAVSGYWLLCTQLLGTLVYRFWGGHSFYFSGIKWCPGASLLGPRVVAYLVFYNHVALFPRESVPLYTPTSNAGEARCVLFQPHSSSRLLSGLQGQCVLQYIFSLWLSLDRSYCSPFQGTSSSLCSSCAAAEPVHCFNLTIRFPLGSLLYLLFLCQDLFFTLFQVCS